MLKPNLRWFPYLKVDESSIQNILVNIHHLIICVFFAPQNLKRLLCSFRKTEMGRVAATLEAKALARLRGCEDNIQWQRHIYVQYTYIYMYKVLQIKLHGCYIYTLQHQQLHHQQQQRKKVHLWRWFEITNVHRSFEWSNRQEAERSNVAELQAIVDAWWKLPFWWQQDEMTHILMGEYRNTRTKKNRNSALMVGNYVDIHMHI